MSREREASHPAEAPMDRVKGEGNSSVDGVRTARGMTRRQFASGLFVGSGIVGGIVSVGWPLMTFENTVRVMKKLLFGVQIDCGDEGEELGRMPFDVIAVPGSGIVRTEDGGFEPDASEKIRLEAAAYAYASGMGRKIALLVGNREEVYLNVGRKYLEDFYQRQRFSGRPIIPDEVIAVISAPLDLNTATNVAEISRFYPKQSVVYITNFFHLARVETYACNRGQKAASVAAEDVIVGADPGRQAEIAAFVQSPETKAAEQKEELGMVSAIWDPTGEFSITRKVFLKLILGFLS